MQVLKVFAKILLFAMILNMSNAETQHADMKRNNRDHRSFMYTSAVNENGKTSSFSIFSGSDGKLHYRKETPEGELNLGLLDEKAKLSPPLLQKDVPFYFPHPPFPGPELHNNLQVEINGAVQNYLQQLGLHF